MYTEKFTKVNVLAQMNRSIIGLYQSYPPLAPSSSDRRPYPSTTVDHTLTQQVALLEFGANRLWLTSTASFTVGCNPLTSKKSVISDQKFDR